MSTQDFITGRTVLVTGANRGLGLALVEEALRRGARRVYAGSRQPFTHADERVVPLTLDITDQAQVAAAAERVEQLDVLVNNAGYASFAGLDDRDELARHLEVNLYGPCSMTHAFLEHLKASRGTLVNVLSLASFAPVPVTPAYSISKAAAFSFTQMARMLFAAQGVGVHAVMAGPLDTDMSAEPGDPQGRPGGRGGGDLRRGRGRGRGDLPGPHVGGVLRRQLGDGAGEEAGAGERRVAGRRGLRRLSRSGRLGGAGGTASLS